LPPLLKCPPTPKAKWKCPSRSPQTASTQAAACSKSPESAWSATTLTTAAYRRLVVAAQVLEGLVDQANESEHGEQRDESAERVAQIGAAQRK